MTSPRKIIIQADPEKRDRFREHFRKAVIGARMGDGSICLGISPDTGRAFYAITQDSMDVLVGTFNAACAHVAKVNRARVQGHDDWRLPSAVELETIWQNRSALKYFFDFAASPFNPKGRYWSSTEHDANNVYKMNNGGEFYFHGKNAVMAAIVCVR